MCDQALSDHCELIITTTEDQQHHILLKPLLDEIHGCTESEKLKQRFNDLLNERSITTMLDLGGRDRSGLDRRQQYPNQNVTVIDIHPGDNVDIVGDAHELTDLLQPQSFGAVISVAVFEHLAMPWKVVLGMNHCLQNNGLGFIVTHQTIGNARFTLGLLALFRQRMGQPPLINELDSVSSEEHSASQFTSYPSITLMSWLMQSVRPDF